MYNFILNMYIMGKIDKDKIQLYVPKFITQQEADDILNIYS